MRGQTARCVVWSTARAHTNELHVSCSSMPLPLPPPVPAGSARSARLGSTSVGCDATLTAPLSPPAAAQRSGTDRVTVTIDPQTCAQQQHTHSEAHRIAHTCTRTHTATRGDDGTSKRFLKGTEQKGKKIEPTETPSRFCHVTDGQRGWETGGHVHAERMEVTDRC